MSGANKGTWTAEFHESLAVSLFTVMGPFTPEKQAALVEAMSQRGHNVSWEAIRSHFPSFPSFTNKQAKMAKWDDAMESQLFQSVFYVLNPQLSHENQAAIVARMTEQGYDVNWNAIR
ncbi:hypothetical protein F5X99DRAFT_404361 [Biscogniauxia marginata]|nr:hypothetical protein F5X99DRAFT_404361 [Biscogniauxia marginata]